MAAIDDYNTAIGNLQTAVQAIIDKVTGLIAQVADDPALAAAAVAVQGEADKINAAVNG